MRCDGIWLLYVAALPVLPVLPPLQPSAVTMSASDAAVYYSIYLLANHHHESTGTTKPNPEKENVQQTPSKELSMSMDKLSLGPHVQVPAAPKRRTMHIRAKPYDRPTAFTSFLPPIVRSSTSSLSSSSSSSTRSSGVYVPSEVERKAAKFADQEFFHRCCFHLQEVRYHKIVSTF